MKRILILLFCMAAAIGVAVGLPELLKQKRPSYFDTESESTSLLSQRTLRVDSLPHEVYRLYSDGELVGVLQNRKKLDEFLKSVYHEFYAESFPNSEVYLGKDVYLIPDV